MTINLPKSDSSKKLDTISVCLATVFYLSYLPSKFIISLKLKFRNQSLEDRKWTGAGMVGSLAGLMTYLLLPRFLATSVISLAVAFFLSVLIADRAEKTMGNHDDSRIVIDEWIGAWLALWGFAQALTPTILVGFILFRILDVFKGPWGLRLQKLPGGWGVVMDDVAAGLLANVLTRVVVVIILPSLSS